MSALAEIGSWVQYLRTLLVINAVFHISDSVLHQQTQRYGGSGEVKSRSITQTSRLKPEKQCKDVCEEQQAG